MLAYGRHMERLTQWMDAGNGSEQLQVIAPITEKLTVE